MTEIQIMELGQMGLAEIATTGLIKKAMWEKLGARYGTRMKPGERRCGWCKEARMIFEFAKTKEGKPGSVCVYCKSRVGEARAIKAARKTAAQCPGN